MTDGVKLTIEFEGPNAADSQHGAGGHGPPNVPPAGGPPPNPPQPGPGPGGGSGQGGGGPPPNPSPAGNNPYAETFAGVSKFLRMDRDQALQFVAGELAGPIGAATVAMAGAIADKVAAETNRNSQRFRLAGQAGAAFADNDFGTVARNATEGMAMLAEELPIVGRMFGALIRQGNAVRDSFAAVVNAFIQRGRELSIYSPQLAVAGAHADVREIQADIREARELGPGLAKMTDAQSKLATELRELILPIKKFLVDILGEMLSKVENVVAIVGDVFTIIKAIADLTEPLRKVLFWVISAFDLLTPLRKVLDWLAEKFGKNKDDFSLLDEFLKMGRADIQPNGQKPVDIAERLRQQRIRLPLFAGF